MKIEKVDAHHHLWWMGSPHYPMMNAPPAERFIGNTGRLKHDFGPREFLPLMKAQNVTRTVYIESHFVPPLDETAFVQQVADEHGFPNAIMGRVDITAPDLAADLDVHMRSPLFRGARIMVNWDADPKWVGGEQGVMRTPGWRRGYAELGARGLIAEVMALPAQLADLAEVAQSIPGTPLVVGHCGMPRRRTPEEEAQWRDGLAALAALPHVSLKISGLGMVDHGWTTASIRPLVDHMITLFTPARAMFASNFPVDAMYGSYDLLWDAFDEITAAYSDADRAALFRETAIRVFGIT